MAISILRESFYALIQKFPVVGLILEKSAQEPTKIQIHGSILGVSFPVHVLKSVS